MQLPNLGLLAMLLVTSSRHSAVAFSARLRSVARPRNAFAATMKPLPRPPVPTRGVYCGGLSPAAAAQLAEQKIAANVQVKADLEAGSLKRVKLNVAPEFRTALRLPKKKKNGRLFVNPTTHGTLEDLGELLARHLGLPLNAFSSSDDSSSGDEEAGSDGKMAGEPLAFLYSVDDAEFIALSGDGDCHLPHELAESKRLNSDEDLARAWAEVDAPVDKDGNYSYLKVHVAPNPAVNWPPLLSSAAAFTTAAATAAAAGAGSDVTSTSSTSGYQMVSFYTFRAVRDPEECAQRLLASWRPLGVVGRVYVSAEGVNAQMAVPAHVMEAFRQVCLSHDEVAHAPLNLDLLLSLEEFQRRPPFRALHVRAREIVADGMPQPGPEEGAAPLKIVENDNQDGCGERLSPQEWHAALDKLKSTDSNDNDDVIKPLVLDCRNHYESEVGAFEGATPLNTETYRDTWQALDQILEGKPKDTPVLTYCTGGIRCVKVGAYLTQRLGFSNVGRLQGGIINYTTFWRSETEETGEDFNEVSKFKGLNFVFNDRMAEEVTPLVSTGSSGDDAGFSGDRRSLEARALVAERAQRVKKTNSAGVTSGATSTSSASTSLGDSPQSPPSSPVSVSSIDGHTAARSEELDAYCALQSGREPLLLESLRLETMAKMPRAAHMVSGYLQGRLLVMLTKLCSATKVLEIGTFTGYSALCFAEGGAETVTTLEIDPAAAAVAARYFAQAGELGAGIDLRLGAPALEQMADLKPEVPYDLVFMDADKRKYEAYLDLLLDSMTPPEEGDSPSSSTSDHKPLVRSGSLIFCDNILWKGRVMAAATRASDPPPPGEDKAAKRDRVLAQAMHEFNVKVRKEKRVEQVVLPLRDGLTLIRVL